MIQQSAMTMVAVNEANGIGSNTGNIQFTSSSNSNTSFFESGHSDQVIVRVQDQNSLSKLNTSNVSLKIGPSENADILKHIKNRMTFEINGYAFYPPYHPYTCMFLKQLNRYGIEGLLNPDIRLGDGKELLHQATPSGKGTSEFKDLYEPNISEVDWRNAKEDIDFQHGGVYATYNWELFYHIPLFIATRLSQDQRFDEAQRWFHYIFDPTETEGTLPYRFWKIKPFQTYTIDEMKKDIEAVMKGGDTVKKQIRAWEENQLNHHLLARFRR